MIAQQLVSRLEQAHIPLPDHYTQSALMQAVAQPYLPEEFPPADFLSDLTPAGRNMVARETRPAIKKLFHTDPDSALAIGNSVGKLCGEFVLSGNIGGDTTFESRAIPGGLRFVMAEGASFELPIEAGIVVDYGMGYNGLSAHVNPTKRGTYMVFGVQKD